MDIKESTTTSIFRDDVDYLHKLKIEKGYASNKIVISKALKVLRDHKLEEGI